MRLLSMLVVSVSLGTACGGGGGGQPDGQPPVEPDASAPGPDAGPDAMLPEELPDPLPTGPLEATVVTFNRGHIDVVKGAVERHAPQVAALKAQDADVLCLQENYDLNGATDYQPEVMAAELADVYPYAFWSTQGITGWGNGLLLVSKHPLYRGRELYFTANDPGFFVDRMAIAADVVTATSHFHVICTHLQAGLDAENLAIKSDELDEIEAWAQAEGYLDGPTLLLGDFNFGPDPLLVCDPQTECPLPPDLQNYDKARTVWTDPNEGFPECTTCRDMFIPLQIVPIYNDEPDQRIDHCFHRAIAPSTLRSAERVLDEPQSIPWNDETLRTLSDHYGMRCVYGP